MMLVQSVWTMMSQAVVFYLSHWTPQRKTVILHTIPHSLHFRVLKIHSFINAFLGITEKYITFFFLSWNVSVQCWECYNWYSYHKVNVDAGSLNLELIVWRMTPYDCPCAILTAMVNWKCTFTMQPENSLMLLVCEEYSRAWEIILITINMFMMP